MNQVLDNMKTRRSVRKFTMEPVPQALIDQVIEAGLYAASGKGEQDVIVIQIADRAVRDKLSMMNRQMRTWTRFMVRRQCWSYWHARTGRRMYMTAVWCSAT